MNTFFKLLLALFVQVLVVQGEGGADAIKCEQNTRCQQSLPEALADFTESLYADIVSRTSHDNFVFSPLR